MKNFVRIKKMNPPESDDKKPNFSEKFFRPLDLVFVEKEKDPARPGRTGYDTRRARVYEVSRVDTFARPFLYKLRNFKTRSDLKGWYYHFELTHADTSQLDVERVLKETRTKDGRTLVFAKFKGHDSSFNRWILKR